MDVMTPQQTAVLHVDDQPQYLDLTRAYLARSDQDLSVLSTSSVAEAFDLLEMAPVNCIVCDYDMPGMDGLEFRAKLVEEGIDLPFILFTGKGSEEIASEAISAGVTDYLQKGGAEQYELLAHSIRNSIRKYLTERHIRNVYDAIDLVGEGISLLDSTGQFAYVNRAYADIFGYAPEELLGEHWSILYRDEADVAYMREHVLPSMEPDGAWRGHTLQVRKDGSLIETDHRLAYTSNDALVCLVSDPVEADGWEDDVPVVE